MTEASTGENALMSLTSLGRDVPQEKVNELVRQALADDQVRWYVPALAAYVRNHDKSRVAREKKGGLQGTGEIHTGRKLFLALLAADQDGGKLMLHLLPAYGSFKDLLEILILAESETAKECLRSALTETVADIFVGQLTADRDVLETAERDGTVARVSNAAKYVPHCNRRQQSRSKKNKTGTASCDVDLVYSTAKIIAKRLFPEEAFPEKSFRKLRSKLNSTGGFVIEKFLAERRAGEADVRRICAGPFVNLRYALLNLTKKSGKPRSEDPGRVELAKRYKTLVATKKVPAPSNLEHLATTLSGVINESNEDLVLVGVKSYQAAVDKQVERLNDLAENIRSLIPSLDITDAVREELLLSSESVPDVSWVVNCSLSQAPILPTIAVLILVCSDTRAKLLSARHGAGFQLEETVVIAALGNLFEVVPLPPSDLSPEKRLKQLLHSLNEFKQRNERHIGEELALGSIVRALAPGGQPAFPKLAHDIVIASDFLKSEDQEGLTLPGHHLTMYRVTASMVKKRFRVVDWDVNVPRASVVFCLDTTGSMGSEIHHAKLQLNNIITSLQGKLGFPVQVAFVSYKDFEDHHHPQIHPWVDPSNPEEARHLQEFIDSLQASGGGDMPEDVACGLEQAIELFRKLEHKSIKIVYHIADAPGHGFGSGDSFPTRDGQCQKERYERALKVLCGEVKAEYVFVNCGSRGDCSEMVQTAESVLEKLGTTADHIMLDRTGEAFCQTLTAVVSGLTSQALNPHAKDVESLTGTDFAVLFSILGSQLSAAAATCNQSGQDKGADSGQIKEEPDKTLESKTALEPETALESKTALESLKQKLEHSNFDLVYATLSALKKGVYVEFQHQKHTLLSKCVKQMVENGVTPASLRDNGYPETLVRLIHEYALRSIACG